MTTTTSTMPAPGDLVGAFWEGDLSDVDYVEGGAVVLATSRHKARLTDAEAVSAIQARWGPTGAIDRKATWRRVTQADLDGGESLGDVDLGGWHEAATGRTWVEVAYVEAEPE